MTDISLIFRTCESGIDSTVVEMRKSSCRGWFTSASAVTATRTPTIANPDLDKDKPMYSYWRGSPT